jgi:hypothetical protein
MCPLQVEYQIETAGWLAESGCDTLSGMASPEALLLAAAAAILGARVSRTNGTTSKNLARKALLSDG